MFEILDQRTRLTANQIKILAAAIIGDALEFFDYFLIGFVLAFLIGPWKLTFGQSAIVLMSSGVGAIVGVVLGLAFALNIEAIRQWLQHTFGLVLFDETLYLLAEMPSHIDWQEVVGIGVVALVFALAASLYPAARAARLDPVEGLRRE